MAEYIDKESLIAVLKNREDCVGRTDTDCVDCMCDFIACITPSDVAEREKPNCESCDIRKYFAKSYDIHFDERDCPIKCERKQKNKSKFTREE